MFGMAPKRLDSVAQRDIRQERFGAPRVFIEYPVTAPQPNGQVLKGWIDVLVETEEGWIIIDHKATPRPKSEWPKEAVAYSGQLAAYVSALTAAGKYVSSTWLHFPVGGCVIEVGLAG